MTYRKKLIEVALPLPEINDASSYDKMPGIGPHPKGIHHWWARLPLPTARAVLFASVVDDPETHPEKWPTEETQNEERERLFDIVRRMMSKRLHEHPEIYDEVRREMLRYCDGQLPPVFDPFAGGGSIPLEANRLGFRVYAGDLNPVAVLLNKCNLELAPRWAGKPPINPEDRKSIGHAAAWHGTHGLAADVRYYARRIRDGVREEIGHLYPKAQLPKEYSGGEANVIAWIWARTVASPNPAAQGKHVPLISTYWLSSKKGKEVWLEPIVSKATGTYHFEVRSGTPKHRKAISRGTKVGRSGFQCLLTNAPIPFDYIRSEGQQGRLGMTMLAVVVEGQRGRLYLTADSEQIHTSLVPAPSEYPDTDLPDAALGFRVQNYGIRKHWQMFTSRQLTAMVTMSDLVMDIFPELQSDAKAAGLSAQDANAYAETLATFLALSIDRCADFNNALCRWSPSNEKVMNLFSRSAIPMVWDYSEANILGESVGAWSTCSEYVADCVEVISVGPSSIGIARQHDAATEPNGISDLLVSTDPPYYDNIGYAALSDFFYVWLRRTIHSLYPDLFSTVLVPKVAELTASPERFDGDEHRAKEHFEAGFRKAFTTLRAKTDPNFPLTVYYAFKQADEEGGRESEDDGDGGVDLTTGWETLLEALISSGFQITATWPVRASQAWRMRAMGSNALASYIVLACRPRPVDALQTDRRSFVAELRRELPAALSHLQQGNIAPVDLAQASIGPGMAVYSRYSKVLEPNGDRLTVRTALQLINYELDTYLAEQEGHIDEDSRFAVAWFDQFGFREGPFGQADVLARAKNTSVDGLAHAGVLRCGAGKVQLYHWSELDPGWDPATDRRVTMWEAVHHLVERLNVYGEEGAARLLAKMPAELAAQARQLAYRLYSICERKGWAEHARDYNSLVISWGASQEQARGFREQYQQGQLF